MKRLWFALMLMALPAQAREFHPLFIQHPDGSSQRFRVEWATTEPEREHGLMGRTSMPADQGMLFLYPEPGHRAFWMKDTLIPLDMLFFTSDGTIAYIYPNAIPEDLTPIAPSPARYDICAILELNGGQAAKSGLKEGDRMVLTGPSACLP